MSHFDMFARETRSQSNQRSIRNKYDEEKKFFTEVVYSGRVRRYLQVMPRVCERIQVFFDAYGPTGKFRYETFETIARTEIRECLKDYAEKFLMNEIEIACWIVYIDLSQFIDTLYESCDDPRRALDDVKESLNFYAYSAKCHLNDEEVNRPIQAHIQKEDPDFQTKYEDWVRERHELFQNDELEKDINQTLIKLDKQLKEKPPKGPLPTHQLEQQKEALPQQKLTPRIQKSVSFKSAENSINSKHGNPKSAKNNIRIKDLDSLHASKQSVSSKSSKSRRSREKKQDDKKNDNFLRLMNQALNKQPVIPRMKTIIHVPRQDKAPLIPPKQDFNPFDEIKSFKVPRMRSVAVAVSSKKLQPLAIADNDSVRTRSKK